ncbi:MAG: lipase maturation factor family protein [Candidatus Woesearchaeota archaeon]|nr:lipase maturation factor family protein [Candidatus Woesearchaeota archaeon]
MLSWIKLEPTDYSLTRFVLLRFLGFVYFFAFLSLAVQVLPLIGSQGILPADLYMERLAANDLSFIDLPSLFWLHLSDSWLLFFSWFGVLLSLAVLLGFANIPMLLILWFLYMSFMHIGQLWYGYGWEMQLLETGFLALFLVPLWDARPFPKHAVPFPIIVLFRWLAFRINLGAGLIKIRGDECWKDLTCLQYHYETQPIPGPLTSVFHEMPVFIHKLGVLWNHFIELVVPWFVFWPRLLRYAAGILLISFQFILIASGNLSFLNWLTIVPAIACFDDVFFRKILPKKLVHYSEKQAKGATVSRMQTVCAWTFLLVVLVLSIPVVQNLLSERQAMNTSFGKLHLVNTYGAFGSIGKERGELVIEGTADAVVSEQSIWKEYELPGKPTKLDRNHPQLAPYQPRIDWQIWFAAMSHPNREPWLWHVLWKLLHNDPGALSLFSHNPFPDEAPEHVRIMYYKYKLAPLAAENIWEREFVGIWFPPISKEHQEFQTVIARNWGE